ncbi:MAG: S8 family serine peptidase [Hyphomonadaceae bacterium]
MPNPASAEAQANWGVLHTGADAAWNAGLTGDGVLIGVIDDGIHPDHPELQGRISPASIDINTARNALVTDQSHGSELASLIAGNFNGAQTIGVAYGATILAVRADDGADGFTYQDLANALDYAVAQGVDIVNFSLGSPFGIGDAFRDAIADATAAGVIIVVSAGNNGPTATEVNYPGRLASDLSVSNGLMIVAGGLNANGSINTISNLPGENADWYLTAPGWEIIVPDYGPAGAVPGFQLCGAAAGLPSNLCEIQGTSYASPHIAGALALLMEDAPHLSPQQLVELLLESAEDAGAVGVDALYGRGVLSIENALAPVGGLMTPTAEGGLTSFFAPVGVVGPAFGDAFSDSVAWRAAAFDSYGRTFDVSLASRWRAAPLDGLAMGGAPVLWRTEEGPAGLHARLGSVEASLPFGVQRRMLEAPDAAFHAAMPIHDNVTLAFAAHAPALQEAAPGVESAHLGFGGADLSVAITRPFGDARVSLVSQSGEADLGPGLGRSARRAAAIRVEQDMGAWRAGATFGVLREADAALGLAWDRAWGARASGVTEFFGVHAAWTPLENVRLGAFGEFGRAHMEGGGWLSLDAPLQTSAAAAAIEIAAIPDALADLGMAGAWRFAVSQPLRVEAGALNALLPVADRWGRQSLQFEERRISATPSGREIEARLSYWLWSGARLTARAELAHRTSPGHDADAAAAMEALVGLRFAY